MSLAQEFREFAMKGNVMDLAVGVIIGGAFGKIISSLVENVLMPFIGLFLGGVDFSKLAVKLGSAELKYGAFVQSVFDFLIIAFCIFMMIKALNSLKKPVAVAAAPPPPSASEAYLKEIRDALVKK
ncbi:MAG: large-conductance mechanosensitive channel protein MscL [Hyphomicrobium sp.]